MAFHVGQKVQCVEASGAENLVEGRVYTVTAVGMNPPYRVRGGYTVSVAEARPNAGHIAFWSWRFRPLVNAQTSIAVFTSLLAPNYVPERV